MGKKGNVGNFERSFRSTAALHSSGRCSKYYSTSPLSRNCKPCIRTKFRAQNGPVQKNGGVDGGDILDIKSRLQR